MRNVWWWLAGILVWLAIGGCGARQAKLRERLAAESTEERLRAVEAVAHWRSPQAVELLKQALLDPDSSIRVKAVEALGERPEPEAKAALLEVLKGDHWRRAALSAYEKAVEYGAEEAGVRISMGRLYKDLGDKDKALEQAEMAEALAQDNPYELMSVQFLYSDLGQTEKAKELEKRVKELQPGTMPGGTFTIPPSQ